MIGGTFPSSNTHNDHIHGAETWHPSENRIDGDAPSDTSLIDEGSDPKESKSSIEPTEAFNPARCLFCRRFESDIDANVEHMQKQHGLVIQDQGKLLVDVETLLGYLHLVITGYYECIYCGTQRHSAGAIRHHMMDKGHCKLDPTEEDSQYRDFYEIEDDDATDSFAEAHPSQRPLHFLQPDETHGPGPRYRKQRSPRAGKARIENSRPASQPSGQQSQEQEDPPGEASKALIKEPKSRGGHDLAGMLARLRESDRRSLIHLPAAQQRAVLLTHQRQVEKMRREERRMLARTERMGNKTLMKHFVPDVPGRSNG